MRPLECVMKVDLPGNPISASSLSRNTVSSDDLTAVLSCSVPVSGTWRYHTVYVGTDPAACVSEEAFVSAMISSGKVNASPDELAAAYAYAAGGGGVHDDDRGISLENLAAFAADSGPVDATQHADGSGSRHWVGWIFPGYGDGGAAARRALIKARVKCRDAGLLGRSFPGQAFARLDPEGAGRVSRLAFMRALREMGFALVDEEPEGTKLGALGDAPWQSSSCVGDTAAGQRSAQVARKNIGGDNLGIMAEDVARDEAEVRMHKAQVEEEEEARRMAFRAKVEQIERAAAEKVRNCCWDVVVAG